MKIPPKDQDSTLMNKSVTKDESFKPLVILGIIILVIWILSFATVYFTIDSWSDRGTFGDLFGGVNSLFSGLALAGIIYTIFLQRKELKLQRLELAETRKELKRSAEAQEKSEKALKDQANSMKKSSQLAALSSMLEYYKEERIRHRNNPNKVDYLQAKKEDCIHRIEHILSETDE